MIILVLGIGLIQDRVRLLLVGQQSLQWPTVVGEVVDAGNTQIAGSQSGRNWTLRVRYAYEVEGRTHENDRITFSRQIGGRTRVQADDELRQYVPGGPIVVHYDADRPQRSVLRPGPDRRAYFGLTVGVGLILIALLFWTVPTRSGRTGSSAR